MAKIEIGITGGIGSGKSIVSHILSTMGYPIYDTDSKAKILMNSKAIIEAIKQKWGNKVLLDNKTIDRNKLASIVFANKTELQQLNNIVHPAVKADYAKWVIQQQADITFVESAILQQAQMDTSLQQIWLVEADLETRIQRVMKRNNMQRCQVEARIAAQAPYIIDHRTHTIINDNKHAIIPQIIKLLHKIEKQ